MQVFPKRSQPHPWGNAPSAFEELGGIDRVEALVNAFYDHVEAESPLLRDMLPADTSTSRRKLFEFLCGWLGGPPLYWEKHGHPQLRMRHARFDIDDRAAAEWVTCLAGALDDIDVTTELRTFLLAELGQAAHYLRNQP